MQGTSVQHAVDVQHKTKKVSPPNFWMLIMIQINLLKATTSDVMTNIAGGFLFNAYAYMRGEQSGNCSFSFVALLKKEGRFKGTEMLHCMVFREKPPKLKNAVPRPFWLCVPGIQGGRKWFDRLLSTFSGLQGQRKVKCVYRDFAAPGNSHDPRRATEAMLSPLTDDDDCFYYYKK